MSKSALLRHFFDTVLGMLAGFKPTPIATVVLTLAVMLVNFVGLLANYQHAYDLRILQHAHNEMVPDDPVVRALAAVKSRKIQLSPTNAFALYLPLAFVGWFVFLVLVWPF